jgi:hypothetical protein
MVRRELIPLAFAFTDEAQHSRDQHERHHLSRRFGRDRPCHRQFHSLKLDAERGSGRTVVNQIIYIVGIVVIVIAIISFVL